MAPVVTALAASLVSGGFVGGWCATTGWANGVRPRPMLREHSAALRSVFLTAAGVASVTAAAAVAVVERARWALAPTCVAIGILFALASWLVSVEPDEGGEDDFSREPEWWPEFERELEAWRRRERTPAGPRA